MASLLFAAYLRLDFFVPRANRVWPVPTSALPTGAGEAGAEMVRRKLRSMIAQRHVGWHPIEQVAREGK